MKNIKIIGIVVLVFIIGFFLASFLKKPEGTAANIYFTKVANNKILVLPVKRDISSKTGLEKIVITELLKGPSESEVDSGYGTEIPRETRLLEVREFRGSIVINLSQDFASGGGSESMIARYNQLAKTAIDAAGDKKVYLELNNKRITVLSDEGIEIPQPIKPIE